MKAFNYSIMILGMLLLLEFGGIPVGTNLLSLVGIGVDDFTLSISTFFDFLFDVKGILAVGVGAAIIIGSIARTAPENYIVLSFIFSVLVKFIQAFTAIINYSRGFDGWIFSLIVLLMSILGFGFVFTLIEFFRGTD
jgi:hypothetical protein